MPGLPLVVNSENLAGCHQITLDDPDLLGLAHRVGFAAVIALDNDDGIGALAGDGLNHALHVGVNFDAFLVDEIFGNVKPVPDIIDLGGGKIKRADDRDDANKKNAYP